MKEVIARTLIAVVGFLVMYLLMSFVVNSLDTTQWTLDQRGTVAVAEGLLIVMIYTFPAKLTE